MMSTNKLRQNLIGSLICSLVFLGSQSAGGDDTAKSVAVAPGPLQQQREQLIAKIQGAKKFGIGISTYVSAFDSLENQVKAGIAEAILKGRIESISRSLEAQIANSTQLKMNSISVTRRSSGPRPNASVSSTPGNAIGPGSTAYPSADLRCDGIYVASEPGDNTFGRVAGESYYILWFAGQQRNMGNVRMAIWSKHNDEDTDRFLARAWKGSKSDSISTPGQFSLDGQKIKFELDQIAYAGIVGPRDLTLDWKRIKNGLTFHTQRYVGPNTPSGWLGEDHKLGHDSGGSYVFRFRSDKEMANLSREVTKKDQEE